MNLKISTTLLALAFALLIGCQGKQGDPGPAGTNGTNGTNGTTPTDPFINGSFSGTITGKKRDGTACNETFNYTTAYNSESFYPVAGHHELNLSRNATSLFSDGSISLNLLVYNKGLANQTISLNPNYNSRINFSKEIANSQDFQLNATISLKSTTYNYPVDPANSNYSFNFSFYSDGSSQSNYYSENGNNYYYYTTKNNETVYYNYPGATFYKIIDANGVTSTTSAKYGALNLYYGNSGFYFKDAAGVDISKKVTVPADTYTITNYAYNTTTSTLSFDFTLNIAGSPRQNTTTYPLLITGKFIGKVLNAVF